MNFPPHDPFVRAVIFVTTLVVGLEGYFLVQTNQQARHALRELDQKRAERASLQQSPVPASEGNAQAVSRALAGAGERLAIAQTSLAGADQAIFSVAPPSKPIDGYFDLADFVEKTRSLAAQAQVATKLDDHFGFNSHVTEGPGGEWVAAVFRQRIAVQFLVGALIEARPTALLSIQRERPLSDRQRTARNFPRGATVEGQKSTAVRDDPADFFELTPAISLRIPERMDTDAFKLEFSGQTGTLRLFLNRLAFCELALVVRSVEVEPLVTVASPSGAGRTSGPVTLIPIVAQTISRFRVIVEFVRPLGATERPKS